MEEKHKGVVLILLVVVFGYLSLRILAPFANYLLLGLLLAFLFHPAYKLLAARMNKTASAALLMIGILIVVVVPSLWLTSNLITQTTSAIDGIRASGFSFNGTSVQDIIGADASRWIGLRPTATLNEVLAGVFTEFRSAITTAIPSILSIAGDIILGVVLVCFVLYYGLKEGDVWVDKVVAAVPMKRSYKTKLRKEIDQATRALFFGQVLTAVLIGVLCGVLFATFGVANPIFWGFIMVIFSFLPIVGAPMIFIPAGILLMYNSHWWSGIAIIVLCSLVVLVVDNIVRPKFVSNTATIHPLTVIIGALGGIAFMGFVGFVIGPLILNIFMTIVSFDY